MLTTIPALSSDDVLHAQATAAAGRTLSLAITGREHDARGALQLATILAESIRTPARRADALAFCRALSASLQETP